MINRMNRNALATGLKSAHAESFQTKWGWEDGEGVAGGGGGGATAATNREAHASCSKVTRGVS